MVFYHTDAYPLHMIGPGEVLWQATEQTIVKVWLRLHPSIHDAVWSELKLAVVRDGTVEALQVRDLRGELDSFELTGPRSGQVLARVLRVVRSENAETKQVRLRALRG